MAQQVNEIMSRELFYVTAEEPYMNALLGILSLGITGCPVLDPFHRPLGVVSLRDLMGERGAATCAERMTSPAVTIDTTASVEDAAHRLEEYNVHRLVVVDDQQRAVGMVSSMDLVRALVGVPARHPQALIPPDSQGLKWTEPRVLGADNAESAPTGPGLLVLIHGGVSRPEIPVWAESASDLRERLIELSDPSDVHPLPPQLAFMLKHEREHLSYRVASIGDAEQRLEALLDARRKIATDRPPPA